MQTSQGLYEIISDLDGPVETAIYTNMTSNMQFNDYQLANLLKDYQPKKKQAKNPTFFTRFQKHDLQTVYETLLEYNSGKRRTFLPRPSIDFEQLIYKIMPLIIEALIKRTSSSLKSGSIENTEEEKPVKLTLKTISGGSSKTKGTQNQSSSHPKSGPYQSSTPDGTPYDSANDKKNNGNTKGNSKAREVIDLLQKLIHGTSNSFKTKSVWPMVQIPDGIISSNKDPASKKKVEVRLDEVVESIIDSLSKNSQNSLLTLAFLIPYAFAGQILPKSKEK